MNVTINLTLATDRQKLIAVCCCCDRVGAGWTKLVQHSSMLSVSTLAFVLFCGTE